MTEFGSYCSDFQQQQQQQQQQQTIIEVKAKVSYLQSLWPK